MKYNTQEVMKMFSIIKMSKSNITRERRDNRKCLARVSWKTFQVFFQETKSYSSEGLKNTFEYRSKMRFFYKCLIMQSLAGSCYKEVDEGWLIKKAGA